MKRNKIIYWTSTILIGAGMLMSAAMYLTQNPQLMESFKTISIPTYLIMLLGTAKLLGAIALVIPKWEKLKEWAYAGFTFTFIGAIWTHLSTGTPWVGPLVFLLVLAVSYFSRLRIQKATIAI